MGLGCAVEIPSAERQVSSPVVRHHMRLNRSDSRRVVVVIELHESVIPDRIAERVLAHGNIFLVCLEYMPLVGRTFFYLSKPFSQV